MSNAPCTPLGDEEEARLFGAFPDWLTPEQEERAEAFFPVYLFYRSLGRSAREVWCSACGQWHEATRQSCQALFRRNHGDAADCPGCGRRGELKALGRYTNFDSLAGSEPVAALSAGREYLLMQAGHIHRRFAWEYDAIVPEYEFIPTARYVFAPGVRLMWKRSSPSWFGCYPELRGEWERMPTVREPFAARAYAEEAPYWLAGEDALARGPLRYCQYAAWFEGRYGGMIGGAAWEDSPFRVAWLAKYLAEYTRRPQMELLVKLGHADVVSELVIHGRAGGGNVNWKAKDPPGFFRLSKADYRTFRDNGFTLAALREYRRLRGRGQVGSLEEFAMDAALSPHVFDQLIWCVSASGVTMERAVNYIRRQAMGRIEAVQLWHDYLHAALELEYDLTRDDVRLPRQLRERHDAAAAARIAARDESAARRAEALHRKLSAQFTYEADGLRIAAPAGIEDIIREGRELEHCVGGYAARHANGQVIILFLRRAEEPDTPYVTIEVSTDRNPQDIRIVQMHGFQNERDGGMSPLVRHEEFIAGWLDWVRRGSPRDVDGNPEIETKVRMTA